MSGFCLSVRTPFVRTISLFCGIFFLAVSLPSFSSTNVYFAGFALAGNASETIKAFPITSRLLAEKSQSGQAVLEQMLWNHIRAVPHPAIKLNTQLADGRNASDAVAMAFVLDWENIARERIAGSTKLVADIHGQILVFDFASKKAIGSYPVAAQLIHTVDGEASARIDTELIRSLYMGRDGNSIFRQVAERLASVKVTPSAGNYLQVVSVELEDKARETIREFGQDEAVLAARTADMFGKRLYENAKVAYVPYTKGTSIGSKMAARFANGEVYQFELPSPDYRVHLRLRGFKKVLLDSTSVESAWAYGSYINVAIRDFDDHKTYLDAPFKFGAVKKTVAGASDLDDWSAFQESLFMLIDQVTLQATAPDSGWVEKWSTGAPAMAQLKDLKRVLERSR